MIKRCKETIIEVKDFPKPGIGFKDLTPLVEDPVCFRYLVERLASWAEERGVEQVVGIESRGFLFGGPVAYRLGKGMALVRKKGKLPRETACIQAPNEYAVEYFEMHRDSIKPGAKVVIIDDLIATGSSSISAIELVKQLGGEVAGFAVIVDLTFLNGIDAIHKSHPDVEILSLISLND